MADFKRVAIVTGSGQGIGKAIALRLASDGYDLALFDLPSNRAKLEEVVAGIANLKKNAITILGDVTKENDVESLVETTVKELGRLDVVRPTTLLHDSQD